MKKDKANDKETLGGRMKGYESDNEASIPNDQHIIIRIDGHHFSKFTKQFDKPFDSSLSYAMKNTTIDLVDRFGAVTGYTQSDEISLILPSLLITSNISEKSRMTWEHPFSGRVQKICSLVAAYTTIRFNYHLKDHIDFKLKSFSEGIAYFDTRIYGVPNNEEAFNSILWRARDAEKNSKSMFAQAYCSYKSLLNKNGEEQIKHCLSSTGYDWNDLPEGHKYGILVKKEQYLKKVDDIECMRTRIVPFVKHLEYSQENVDLIMRTYIQ